MSGKRTRRPGIWSRKVSHLKAFSCLNLFSSGKSTLKMTKLSASISLAMSRNSVSLSGTTPRGSPLHKEKDRMVVILVLVLIHPKLHLVLDLTLFVSPRFNQTNCFMYLGFNKISLILILSVSIWFSSFLLFSFLICFYLFSYPMFVFCLLPYPKLRSQYHRRQRSQG